MQRNREVKKQRRILILCLSASLFLYSSLFGAYSLPISSLSEEGFKGYENTETIELDFNDFVDNFIKLVNEERSYKGLLPLIKDDIATKVAQEHANDLIFKKYLSYFNLKNQGPDERYTLLGGTGAILEVIKGFEVEDGQNRVKTVKLNELLAEHLIQAIKVSADDSQVFFSPYITHIGAGFSSDKLRRQFVSVIDFVTKGGELDPLRPELRLGEKLSISGKVTHPYKFKAVSVAYFDESKINEMENINFYFDNDSLIPYFPPQDYIAYGDKTKSNFINVLKGIGFIGAIGAAPFTGGASAIVAPVILSSIQNATPREIPLKRGINANSKGDFSGAIDLNYQGRAGLYFVSVLGEMPSVNFPIVISRRTVRVIGPLQEISYQMK